MVSQSTSSDNESHSISELNKLKVEELKKILGDSGEPTTGKKTDLVLRCHVLLKRSKSSQDLTSQPSTVPLVDSASSKPKGPDITFEKLARRADGCTWTTDLRQLPSFDFIKLYDYLVIKTAKYEHSGIRQAGYKKLKAYQFFKEGHIKTMQIGEKDRVTFVKGEVLASMKQQKYKVVVTLGCDSGEVFQAACQCPAGRGVDGLGHCNHTGGILFAIEDFCHQGLKDHTEPVSCTSRLCRWNVPRNIKVDPKPVDSIIITKYRFGKQADTFAKQSLYDPRAPTDRYLNHETVDKLSNDLSACLHSSSYFLFYNVEPQVNANSEVVVDSVCEEIPENAPDVKNELNSEPNAPFNDNYDISSQSFVSMMDCYSESITAKEIVEVERMTRGQSSNKAWRDLRRVKLTASNFHAAAVRKKEPKVFLGNIMYKTETTKTVAALEYGKQHEDKAVAMYLASKLATGNKLLKVHEVGTILSKEKPGLGASLDRKEYDPIAKGMKTGGLEVKCPFSKRGMSIKDSCEDKTFFLHINDEGLPQIKFGHKYFYQVQGQMYVCNFEWVDFVVWFDNNQDIFIERVFFNKTWWYQTALPRIDFFYKRAFLPEVLTRRVERKVKLYKHGGWKFYKSK